MAEDMLELLVAAHKSLAGRLERHIDEVVRYRSLSFDEAKAELGALERIVEEQKEDLHQLKEYRKAELERLEASIKDREVGVRDLERRVAQARREIGKREGEPKESAKTPRKPE